MEIIVGIGVGIALGMYVSSQLKCHIRKNINRRNFEEYESKYKDTDCEVFNSLLSQKLLYKSSKYDRKW